MLRFYCYLFIIKETERIKCIYILFASWLLIIVIIIVVQLIILLKFRNFLSSFEKIVTYSDRLPVRSE